MQVFGDSKLVIDQANGKASISNVSLTSLISDASFQINQFDWISFQHVLRELNTIADNLSKEALQLPKGTSGYHELVDGEEARTMESRLC